MHVEQEEDGGEESEKKSLDLLPFVSCACCTFVRHPEPPKSRA